MPGIKFSLFGGQLHHPVPNDERKGEMYGSSLDDGLRRRRAC